METDPSKIGDLYRDAFQGFSMEPSEGLWEKIEQHPSMKVVHKPFFSNPVKLFITAASVCAVVIAVIYTKPFAHKTVAPEITSSTPIRKNEINKPSTETTVTYQNNSTGGKEEVTATAKHHPIEKSNIASLPARITSEVKSNQENQATVIPTPSSKVWTSTANYQVQHSTDNSISSKIDKTTNPGNSNSSPMYSNDPGSNEPFSFSPDTIQCKGESTILKAQGADYYAWSNGESTSSIVVSPTESTSYFVTATDIKGKQLIREIKVVVKDCNPIYIPNSFIPDGDGRNDIFKAKGEGIRAFHMRIFARTGQLVFESYDINEGWNGYMNGKPAEIGTYIYQISFTDSNGKEHTEKGPVNLLR